MGREDTASDDVALDASEPVLDLVEPRRVGWRVVHVNAAMVEQERLHEWRLMAADVVADDVDLAAAGLAGDDVLEEGDELLAGMAWRGLAEHLASAGIERGEQAQRAVAPVFEAVALGASGRQRQHPVLAVERLDRRLLVHAEHGCVRRRVQVEADHVGPPWSRNPGRWRPCGCRAGAGARHAFAKCAGL